MIEVAYEGSTLIWLLALAIPIAGIVTIVGLGVSFLMRSSDFERALEIAPPPQWESTTYYEHKKPVRKRSLPYGAYGTDIRGRRVRR